MSTTGRFARETQVDGMSDQLIERYFAIGRALGWIVGFCLFVGLWIYCIGTYGFLFGVGLGWLPSAITAAIARFLVIPLWGLVAAAAIAMALYLSPDLDAIAEVIAMMAALGVGCKFLGDYFDYRRKSRSQTGL